MSEETKNLISLLYKSSLSQYGKRQLVNIVEKQQNRIDELEKALIDEDFKYRNRIKVLNNRINQVKKYIENIMNSCNGANLGDLQMLLNILEE